MTNALQAERKEYTLKAKHTHAGKDLNPGDKVTLTPRQAAFIAHKLAEVKATTQGESK